MIRPHSIPSSKKQRH